MCIATTSFHFFVSVSEISLTETSTQMQLASSLKNISGAWGGPHMLLLFQTQCFAVCSDPFVTFLCEHSSVWVRGLFWEWIVNCGRKAQTQRHVCVRSSVKIAKRTLFTCHRFHVIVSQRLSRLISFQCWCSLLLIIHELLLVKILF